MAALAPRIPQQHQRQTRANKGLASARSTGLDRATGRYSE
ncbi:hypothetical protein [Streptomyces aurantiogriseus]|nr:hypothetical protein [Streptomyces aurantiogriseus]